MRRDAARSRSRVLAAAGSLIADRGLDVGYEEIAHEAGVGVGTVYRRFPTRDELFHELFDERLDELVQVAEDALMIEDAWAGLCHFVMRDFELQASDRGLREFLLSRPGTDTDLGRRARERVVPAIAELVERAKATGQVRSDVGQTDLGILLAMLGSALDASLEEDPQLWRRYATLVLAAIQGDGEPIELAGRPPSQALLQRVLALWVRPRRRRH
jgi:AcrR family transcriptional regulator